MECSTNHALSESQVLDGLWFACARSTIVNLLKACSLKQMVFCTRRFCWIPFSDEFVLWVKNHLSHRCQRSVVAIFIFINIRQFFEFYSGILSLFVAVFSIVVYKFSQQLLGYGTNTKTAFAPWFYQIAKSVFISNYNAPVSRLVANHKFIVIFHVVSLLKFRQKYNFSVKWPSINSIILINVWYKVRLGIFFCKYLGFFSKLSPLHRRASRYAFRRTIRKNLGGIST